MLQTGAIPPQATVNSAVGADNGGSDAAYRDAFRAKSLVPPIAVHSRVRAFTTQPCKAAAVSHNGAVACYVTADNVLTTVDTQSGRAVADPILSTQLPNTFSIALNTVGSVLAVGSPHKTDTSAGAGLRDDAGAVTFFKRTSVTPHKWTRCGTQNAAPLGWKDVAGDAAPAGARFGSRVHMGVFNETIEINQFVPAFRPFAPAEAAATTLVATPGATTDALTIPANDHVGDPDEDQTQRPTPAMILQANQLLAALNDKLQRDRTSAQVLQPGSATRASADAVVAATQQAIAVQQKHVDDLNARAAAASTQHTDGERWYTPVDVVAVSSRLVAGASGDAEFPFASAAFLYGDSTNATGHLFIPSFRLVPGFAVRPAAPAAAQRKFDGTVNASISVNGTRAAISYNDTAFIVNSRSLPYFSASSEKVFALKTTGNHVWGAPSLSHSGYVVAIPSVPTAPSDTPARIAVYTEDQVRFFDHLDRTAFDTRAGTAAGGRQMGGTVNASQREITLPTPPGTHAIASVRVSPDGWRVAAHFPEVAELWVYTVDDALRLFDYDVYRGFGEAAPEFAEFPGSAATEAVDVAWVNNQQLLVASQSGTFAGAWLLGRPPARVGAADDAAFAAAPPSALSPVLKPNAPASENTAGAPAPRLVGGGRFPAPDPAAGQGAIGDGHTGPPAKLSETGGGRGGSSATVVIVVVVVLIVVLLLAGGGGAAAFFLRRNRRNRRA
jgi:hypothetical protein